MVTFLSLSLWVQHCWFLIPVCMALGSTAERIAYRPLRRAHGWRH